MDMEERVEHFGQGYCTQDAVEFNTLIDVPFYQDGVDVEMISMRS